MRIGIRSDDVMSGHTVHICFMFASNFHGSSEMQVSGADEKVSGAHSRFGPINSTETFTVLLPESIMSLALNLMAATADPVLGTRYLIMAVEELHAAMVVAKVPESTCEGIRKTVTEGLPVVLALLQVSKQERLLQSLQQSLCAAIEAVEGACLQVYDFLQCNALVRVCRETSLRRMLVRKHRFLEKRFVNINHVVTHCAVDERSAGRSAEVAALRDAVLSLQHAAGIGAAAVSVQRATTGQTLTGNKSHLDLHFAWSPDGRTIAAGTGPFAQLQLWDVATGRPRRSFQDPSLIDVLDGECSRPTGVAWSPDGGTIVRAYALLLVFWNAASGEQIRKVRLGELTSSVAWSPDGTTIATASGGTVALWNAGTGERGQVISTIGPITIAWSPDGWSLAVLSQVATVLWDTRRDDVRGCVPSTGKFAPWSSVAWSPDGRVLVTGSRSGKVVFWDAATAKQVRELRVKKQLSSIAYSPDGRTLATATAEADGPRFSVATFDVLSGEKVRVFQGRTVGDDVTWSPDGCLFAARGQGRRLRIWAHKYALQSSIQL